MYLTSSAPVIICLLGVVFVIVLSILAASIRIVPEYKRLAVHRLGRYIGEKGPGLVVLIPFLDRGMMLDAGDPMAKAQTYQRILGATGETRTKVFQDGTVEIDGKDWSAISQQPIPAGTRVRVARVILEVENL